MSTDLETRVYNNYRAALRSQRGGRAAGRRQEARRMTVERYKVPYAVVKDIVVRFDAVNGVTHEHTVQYQHDLAILNAQRAYDANPVPCRCGSTEMVRVRFNPFLAEIYGEFDLTTLCFRCWLDLESEI